MYTEMATADFQEETQSLVPSQDEDGALDMTVVKSGRSKYTQQEKDDAAKMQEIMDAMKPETLDFTLTCDSYDAVVAAAFGGVHITFLSDDDGKTQRVRIHPCILFLMNSMLFSVQLSCLSCLVLDMKLVNIYKDGNTSWEGFEESPDRQMKLVVKTTMVVVLQMITLKEMLGALRPLFMLMNPVTWFELKTEEFGELTGGEDKEVVEKKIIPPCFTFDGIRHRITGSLFQAWICAPLCIVSQLMQFAIGYYVLTVSMSIILSADKVDEMIFNALVITFVQDLDEHAFTAIANVIHIDIQEIQEFKFEIRRDKEVKEAQQRANDSWKEWVASLCGRTGGNRTSRSSSLSCLEPFAIWFYHGRGGKAKLVENVLIFSLLALVYIRQLFIYCQSISTGILPVARDVCAIYRGFCSANPDQCSEKPEKHFF